MATNKLREFLELKFWDKVGAVEAALGILVVIIPVLYLIFGSTSIEGMAYSHGPIWGANSGITHPDMKKIMPEETNSVYIMRIVIWNGSNHAILNTDISSTSPITIKSKIPVTFTSAEIISKSRNDIKLDTKVMGDSVSISLSSDSAFEKNDGFALLLKLKTDQELKRIEHIDVMGDIKGVSNDFSELPYDVITISGARSDQTASSFMIFGLFSVIILVIIWSLRKYLKYRREKATNPIHYALVIIVSVVLIVFCSWFTYSFIQKAQYIRTIQSPTWYSDTEFANYYHSLSLTGRVKFQD